MSQVRITKLDLRFNRTLGRTVRYWRREWDCPGCGYPRSEEVFGLRADVERIQAELCRLCKAKPRLQLEVHA